VNENGRINRRMMMILYLCERELHVQLKEEVE
jgi:hypothetical protein